MFSTLRLLPAAALLTLAVADVLPGQQPVAGSSNGVVLTGARFETREQLETLARDAESQRRTAQAWLLRSRLERGDFQEGDRVVVVMEGSTVVMDTLQVRAGKVLQFPRMGELSLVGVLRSELTDRIREHLAKYLTTPVVRVTPLLSLAVLGSVTRPGYYYVPADAVLRDVLMMTGGPAANADINRTVVRRSGEVIWPETEVRVALSDGLALDALHLRAGDEVFVPERRRRDTNTMIAMITSGVAIVTLIVNLTNR